MKKIVLKKPVTLAGQETSELAPDFERLTGLDLEAAQAEFDALHPGFAGVHYNNMGYLACVAARALGVNVDEVRGLPGAVYAKLTVEAQLFLAGVDSPSLGAAD